MWVEKQTFGSVAEYDRYKAEILGRVRPRGGAEGKIYNRLLRERMQERYGSSRRTTGEAASGEKGTVWA